MFHPSTSPQARSPHGQQIKWALVSAGVSVLALTAVSAWAQTTAVPAPATTDGAYSSAPADGSKLVYADSRMLGDLAQAHRAEVEAGRIALEKSQNPDVKKFAQTMIDDHGKALSEVEQLGVTKKVKLPDGVGVMHKAKETALKALSGKTFDNQYVKRAGVGDLESTVKLLHKIQKDGKDADLKALADKTLPTVQHHLETAAQMTTQLASAK